MDAGIRQFSLILAEETKQDVDMCAYIHCKLASFLYHFNYGRPPAPEESWEQVCVTEVGNHFLSSVVPKLLVP